MADDDSDQDLPTTDPADLELRPDDEWDETLLPAGHRGEKTEADRAQGSKTRRMTKDIISKRA
ncbi:MAG: hypothetical protein ABW360_16370 [Phenylobacterium sp.]